MCPRTLCALCAVIRPDHCKFASYGPAVLVEEATIGGKLQLDLCSYFCFMKLLVYSCQIWIITTL